jgi:hypothetical protein
MLYVNMLKRHYLGWVLNYLLPRHAQADGVLDAVEEESGVEGDPGHDADDAHHLLCIEYIGVVSVYIQYNCVYYCDT